MIRYLEKYEKNIRKAQPCTKIQTAINDLKRIKKVIGQYEKLENQSMQIEIIVHDLKEVQEIVHEYQRLLNQVKNYDFGFEYATKQQNILKRDI